MEYSAFTPADEKWMRRALELARLACDRDEVPVGAVLVKGNAALGEGFNSPVSANDPTAHAEILALRAAAALVRNYRLEGVTLYVTLEPCVMCAGAMVAARVERLIFAARDLRFGGVRSKFQLAGFRTAESPGGCGGRVASGGGGRVAA